MAELTRRECFSAVAVAAPLSAAATPAIGKTGGIKLCEVFGPGQASRMRLARQLGLN